MDRKKFIASLAVLPCIPYVMSLTELEKMTSEYGASERMPVLFLGHGSPMNAIEENQFVAGFREQAKHIPKPKAIICISAHWFTKGTKITSMKMPETIHDFGGFPQALFDVQYPAPGNPELAAETQTLLQPNTAVLDESWGLDHGAWTVLMHMYPKADIPIIQMSIDYTQPPVYHYELAKKLSSLRDKGVLIVGSGNIVHNLGLVDFRNINKVDYGFDWAVEAREVVNKHLLSGDFMPIVNYQSLGRSLQLAAPSPDHYLPLVYTLGLKNEKDSLSLFNDHLIAGSLSMTSVKIA